MSLISAHLIFCEVRVQPHARVAPGQGSRLDHELVADRVRAAWRKAYAQHRVPADQVQISFDNGVCVRVRAVLLDGRNTMLQRPYCWSIIRCCTGKLVPMPTKIQS